MHKSEEYGKITLKNKDLSLFNGKSPIERFASKFIKHMPYSTDVIRAALLELIEENVLFIDGNSLCQKRMIKDGHLSTVRAVAGKKGANKTNQKYFAEANSQQTETANNEQSIPEEVPEKEPKVKKKKYADTVSLTEKEYAALVELAGEKGAARMIEILDNYKDSHGKRYKSDYKAIKNWVVDKYNEERQKKWNQGS
ncbi:MAG: hypothetical protein LIP01_10505 [Tannerellaceae bacterium]|nr:hypothetical protein [Tannerellaceae bacterium]